MKKILLISILVCMLMTSCTTFRVKDAYLRDTIFSVEQTNNGNYRVFMTHDDVAGYCTTNKELGRKAQDLMLEHNGEVVMQFRAINERDPEWSNWHISDCGSVASGEGYMEMFLMEDIYAVNSR